MTKLGFVIVNYNDYPMTKRLLENIKDYKCLSKIVVVDNHSIDDSVIKLQKHENKKIKILVEGNCNDQYKNVDESFLITNKLDKSKYEIHYMSYEKEPKKWYRIDKFYHKIPHEKVGTIYENCDILIKTSILESFSYPPLEMMATGGYVVALQNDGNSEYLKDNYNSLIYEKGNIDDAINKIKRETTNICFLYRYFQVIKKPPTLLLLIK